MEKDYEMSSPGMRTFYFGSIAVYRNYVTFGQVQRALAEQMEDAVMRKPHRLLGNILHGRRPDRASQHAAVAAASEEGRILRQSMGDNTAALLNFIPRMDPEALLAGYRKILASIYSPSEYFERAQSMIARLGARPKPRLACSDYLALFRSFVRQGIFARYRVTYWRFLGKTFFRTPRHIGQAVTLAIMGHHFFTLTRRLESGIPRRDATS